MKKFTGNYDVLVEAAIQRFQQGGFLTGDVVKIKKNALSNEKLKEASDTVKQRIKELQETDSNLRVSAVKTIRSNTSTGEIGGVTAPSCYFADVVQELNPGLWVNPMTLPLEVLEKVDHENFYPDVPESLRRLNKTSDTGSDEMGAVADTRTAEDLNLPTKNTKLANAQKWDDSKPGAGATKELEKVKESNDENALSDIYEQLTWGKAGDALGAALGNVDANYDFGSDKSERDVKTRTSGSRGSGESSFNQKSKGKGSGLSGSVNLGGMARDVYGALTAPSEEEAAKKQYEADLNQMQRQSRLNKTAEELGVEPPSTVYNSNSFGAKGRTPRTPVYVQPGQGGLRTMPGSGAR